MGEDRFINPKWGPLPESLAEPKASKKIKCANCGNASVVLRREEKRASLGLCKPCFVEGARALRRKWAEKAAEKRNLLHALQYAKTVGRCGRPTQTTGEPCGQMRQAGDAACWLHLRDDDKRDEVEAKLAEARETAIRVGLDEIDAKYGDKK